MNWFDRHFSHPIDVRETDWHYLFLYHWWLQWLWRNQRAGNLGGWYPEELRENFQENFCHYWRVNLICVPFVWFFIEPIYKWVRPFILAIQLGALLMVAYAWITMPEIAAVITLIGAVTGVSGTLASLWVIKNPDQAEAPLIKLGQAIAWAYRTLHLDIPVRWFFTAGKHPLIQPWTITTAAAVAVFLFQLDAETWLAILGWLYEATLKVAILAAIVGEVTMFIGLLVKTHGRWGPWFDQPLTVPSGVKSTFRHAGTMVVANKRKICPFVNLPESRLSFKTE